MTTAPRDHSNASPAANVDDSSASKFVSITVNGAQIQVAERVKVREIVQKASKAGAISGLVDEYVIESVAKEGEHGLDAEITVVELEEFMAVPAAPTTVANRAWT